MELATLLNIRAPVLRHIPQRALRDFTECLTWSIEQYCIQLSNDALFGILAMPKLCLRPLSGKGKFSATELELSVLRRLDVFRQGQWLTLWREFAAEHG